VVSPRMHGRLDGQSCVPICPWTNWVGMGIFGPCLTAQASARAPPISLGSWLLTSRQARLPRKPRRQSGKRIRQPSPWANWEAKKAGKLGPTLFLRSVGAQLHDRRRGQGGTTMANEPGPAVGDGNTVVPLPTAPAAAPTPAAAVPKKHAAPSVKRYA
jgi:hypothetical protein